MATSAPASFSLLQRILHWVTVLLVFFNLIFSDGATGWARAITKDQPVPADTLFMANIHAYVGLTILALTLIRLVVRFVHGVPAEPPEEPAIFQLASKLGHWGFYGLLFLMPFLGIGAYYFGNMTAGFLHEGPVKLLLWLLIIVHVAAALVHQFYWKTNIIRRMTIG